MRRAGGGCGINQGELRGREGGGEKGEGEGELCFAKSKINSSWKNGMAKCSGVALLGRTAAGCRRWEMRDGEGRLRDRLPSFFHPPIPPLVGTLGGGSAEGGPGGVMDGDRVPKGVPRWIWGFPRVLKSGFWGFEMGGFEVSKGIAGS